MTDRPIANPPPSTTDTTSRSTVDRHEINHFEQLAGQWWQPDGNFKPLHRFNQVRIGYIRDAICQSRQRQPLALRPLEGLRLVDIGCGGGLLCEPMTRLGAEVTAIDASERNVNIARIHAQQSGLSIDYRHSTSEQLVAQGECFDVVLALEIIEHVVQVPIFLDSLSSLLLPGGTLVISTINRTAQSWMLAIVGAEYVLRLLPIGTHNWQKFIKPSELVSDLQSRRIKVRDITGASYNPLLERWSLHPRQLAVNYILWGEKLTSHQK